MLVDREEYPRPYTTAELADYYGLSRKGLAFYEEKGILAPQRTDNNKYRMYSLTDCYNLYLTKIYENCGFTLAQTAELLQENHAERIFSRVEERMDEMERELYIRSRMLGRTRRMMQLLRRAQQEPVFDIIQSPALYRLFVRTWAGHIYSREASLEFAAWNRIKPVNTASLLYSQDELCSGKERVNVDIGDVMEAEEFEAIGLEKSKRVTYIPSRKCLRTVLVGGGNDICKRTWLEPALAYMREHRFVLDGDVITSLLHVTGDRENQIRYEEAWFPIAKKGNHAFESDGAHL